MNKKIFLEDNQTIKWTNDGKLLCLHIQQDDNPDNPRDWDSLTTMACWHRNYKLGDSIEDNSPIDFWRRLVREYVSNDEIFTTLDRAEFSSLRLVQNSSNKERYDIYDGRDLEYEGIYKTEVADYAADILKLNDCQKLLEPYIEWMPLWLYDHSGISVSCGERTYPYSDQWDSSAIGYIIAKREKIMSECCVSETEWREKAIANMKHEVAVYNDYLSGAVFGYTLYVAEEPVEGEEPDWEEVGSCWGFYGDEIQKSGMLDQISDGLSDALANDCYEIGKAERCVTVTYKF